MISQGLLFLLLFAFQALEEIKAIGKISGPTAISSLLLYSRSIISMLFLGYPGELDLAGSSRAIAFSNITGYSVISGLAMGMEPICGQGFGAKQWKLLGLSLQRTVLHPLAIGFANITGYSVISGLAMGMEPICGHAYGAKQWKLLGLTLQRMVLLLLSASVSISFMWVNMKGILLWCGQDQEISSVAHTFILFSLPDLLFLLLLHPLCIQLQTQRITLPVTYCSAISVLLHVLLNFLLIVHFKLGVAGVAMAMVWTNLNLFLLLSSFVYFSGVYKDSWVTPSTDCIRGWSSLLALALPTCASVCLEWWWYEFMILLCGLLVNPKATVASMGILIQTTSLVYCSPSALSVGVSTRVGNELCANRPGKARISMMVSLFCAVAIGLAAMLFTTLMRHQWDKFFTSDAEILELTAVALQIAGLCELGNCLQTTVCRVLRGSARPTIGANINLWSFSLVGMPVSILMGFMTKMGFAGLWLGLHAAQASCAFVMLLVLCRTDWMLQVEKARLLAQTSARSLLIYSRATFDDFSLIPRPLVPSPARPITKKGKLMAVLIKFKSSLMLLDHLALLLVVHNPALLHSFCPELNTLYSKLMKVLQSQPLVNFFQTPTAIVLTINVDSQAMHSQVKEYSKGDGSEYFNGGTDSSGAGSSRAGSVGSSGAGSSEAGFSDSSDGEDNGNNDDGIWKSGVMHSQVKEYSNGDSSKYFNGGTDSSGAGSSRAGSVGSSGAGLGAGSSGAGRSNSSGGEDDGNDGGTWKPGASSSGGHSSDSSDDDEDDGDNNDGIWKWKLLPESLRKRLEDLCRSNPKLCNMLNGIWESLPAALRAWLEDKLAGDEDHNDGISRFLKSLWEWLEEGWFIIGNLNKHLKEICFISTIGKAAWEWRYYLFILAGLVFFLRKNTTQRKRGKKAKKGKKDKKRKPYEKTEDSENGQS